MWSGFLTRNGAGSAAWTAEYPQSAAIRTPGPGMDLWCAGVALAALAGIALAACQLATIAGRRAPGMTLLRMPVFTWSMLVTCLMTVASFPALVLAMALLLADRHGVGVFHSAGGPAAYQNIFWFYGHPVVYVMFFPFLGAVLEVVSTFSRRRVFGYRAIVISLLVFTALSMSVWGHHMFTTGQVANGYFSLTSTMLAVPAGLEYLGDDRDDGRRRDRAAHADALRARLHRAVPRRRAERDLRRLAAAGLPRPRLLLRRRALPLHAAGGQRLRALRRRLLLVAEGHRAPALRAPGRVHFWLFVVGTNLTFIPQFVLGYDGMPRRVADYSPAYGWAGWNTASTVGAGIVALSVLVFLVNVALTSIAGKAGRRRPVGGPHARMGDDLAAAAPQLHARRSRPSAPTRRCSTCARRRSCEERRPVLAWALLLAALATLLALWTEDLVAVVLLPGAVLVVLVVAAGRRRAPATRSSAWCPRRARAACWPRAGSRCWPSAPSPGCGRRSSGRVCSCWRSSRPCGSARVSGAAVLLAELVAAGALYRVAARRVRRWPPWRGACFAAGLAALGVALLALDAGRSVTAHMAQHLVLAFVAAPLLVLGSPLALGLRATRARRALRAAWLARPGVGWVALAALMALSQLPAVYDATARHPLLHVAEHAAWLAAAVLFWRVVVGADPVPHRPGAARGRRRRPRAGGGSRRPARQLLGHMPERMTGGRRRRPPAAGEKP